MVLLGAGTQYVSNVAPYEDPVLETTTHQLAPAGMTLNKFSANVSLVLFVHHVIL